jgi:hypothetical protein
METALPLKTDVSVLPITNSLIAGLVTVISAVMPSASVNALMEWVALPSQRPMGFASMLATRRRLRLAHRDGQTPIREIVARV